MVAAYNCSQRLVYAVHAVLAQFAAAMSTIDSGVNGVSSVIVFDWFGGRQLSLRVSRSLTAGLGLVVVLAALYVDSRDDNLIDVITAIAGTALGMLMGVYLLGMLVRRANLPGMLCGVATGSVALSIANWHFEVPVQWLGLFSIVPTFLVGWMASWLFAPPSQTALEGTLWRSGVDTK